MVIFSGIQPTGRKHLGNYIGAILNYVKGQDKADPAIYCIVDLHGTTVAYEPEELRRRSRETAALLVAAGLFLRSLRNVARADLGLAVERFATFTLAPELSGYAPARRKLLLQGVEEAVATMPGVTGVERHGATVSLVCSDSDVAIRALLARFDDVRDIEIRGAGLEEAFLELTGDVAQRTELAESGRAR